MNPTPREFFRKHHKEDADKLAEVVNEPWFQRAIMSAKAEMSMTFDDPKISEGGREFVKTLYDLTQEQPTYEAVPDHSDAAENLTRTET